MMTATLQHIEPSAKTPEVSFATDRGELEISGRSIPENALEFYKPLYDWLEAYIENPAERTTLHIKLEYFNTSSSKCLLDIFKKVERLQNNNASKVDVKWYYEEEDEDMLEAGEDYDVIVSIPFTLVAVEEM